MITDENTDKIINLRKKKYGFAGKLIGLLTSQKGSFIVYSIQLID